MSETELPAWVKPGATFRVVFGKRANLSRRFHVRGVVDGRVVLREWWRTKKIWSYSVEGPTFFHVMEPNIRRGKS